MGRNIVNEMENILLPMMMICFSDTFEIKKDLKETNEIRRLAAGIDYTMLMLVISASGSV